MAWTKVHDTAAFINAASGSVTVPATTIGNLLIFTFTGASSTVTFNFPVGGGTWAVGETGAGGPPLALAIHYCVCTTSVTSISFTSNGGNTIDVDVAEFSGVGASPLDVVGVNSGSSATMIAPTLSAPALANELWWAAGSAGATFASTFMNANTPTNSFSVGGIAGPATALATAYFIATDSVAHTTTWPLSGSTLWGEIIVSFKPATFTVTFNANGGTGSLTAQTASSPTNLSLFSTGTMAYAGHTFTGWNTLANGSGTAYADGASYPFASSTTLYAQWTANASVYAPTMGWLAVLNSLAGTQNLGENAAANFYAYGSNHQNGLLKALNDKAGTSNLGLDAVCNVIAGTKGLSALNALNQKNGT